MSPYKAGRNFRSFSGRKFFVRDGHLVADQFAGAVSRSLRIEYGDTHAAVKIIARLTGANARSAKNWLEGRNAPNGRSLVALCRHSDWVFETVVHLSGREEILKAKKLVDARRKLQEIVSLLDELETGAASDCPPTWPATPWATNR